MLRSGARTSRQAAVYEIGDALLFALSAWGRCTWQRFRSAFDDLHTRSLSTTARATEEPDSNVRANAARTLDALGHCDVLFGAGSDAVFAAPSVLAALPVAGLSRAVLCGSRSPESLGILQDAAGRAGRSAQVHIASQISWSPHAPARIEVRATSEALIDHLAHEVGVAYERVPPAWSLSSFGGSLEGFLKQLTWSKRPDLTWPRTDFDPGQLRFTGRQDSDALTLSRYQDPVRGRWLFWLWHGEESAEIDDPSWGRYAVLMACRRRVLEYDVASGELAVPAGARLPRLISRAATLCSGYAPRTIARAAGASDAGTRTYHVYRSVPPDVYDVLAGKLGQLAGGDETS